MTSSDYKVIVNGVKAKMRRFESTNRKWHFITTMIIMNNDTIIIILPLSYQRPITFLRLAWNMSKRVKVIYFVFSNKPVKILS